MAVGVVGGELVSGGDSLFVRERTGKLARFRHRSGRLSRDSSTDPVAWKGIPCELEQEIFRGEHGTPEAEQGIDVRGATTRFTTPLDPDADERLVNARGRHPLVGSTNPIAPHIEMRVEGDRTVGNVTFDIRFEGNEGWVHRGFVAASLDIVAVQASRLSGRSGPTGALTARFVAPTPIGVPLRYEGRFLRSEGRKLFSEGRLVRLDDGSVTAEATAIVVAFD